MTATVSALTMAVSDIARSTAFYEALGWQRSSRSTPTMSLLFAESGIAIILELASDLGGHVPGRTGGIVPTIVVNRVEDVHRTLGSAVHAGARTIRPVTQQGYGCHAYFADYDGQVWEVLESPGLAVSDTGMISAP